MMPNSHSPEDPVSLSILESAPILDYLSLPTCPSCEETLSLHIPDPQLPDRMLAVCEDCKSWYLLNPVKGRMTLLPDL
jgi:hypothetical protein